MRTCTMDINAASELIIELNNELAKARDKIRNLEKHRAFQDEVINQMSSRIYRMNIERLENEN